MPDLGVAAVCGRRRCRDCTAAGVVLPGWASGAEVERDVPHQIAAAELAPAWERAEQPG